MVKIEKWLPIYQYGQSTLSAYQHHSLIKLGKIDIQILYFEANETLILNWALYSKGKQKSTTSLTEKKPLWEMSACMSNISLEGVDKKFSFDIFVWNQTLVKAMEKWIT